MLLSCISDKVSICKTTPAEKSTRSPHLAQEKHLLVHFVVLLLHLIVLDLHVPGLGVQLVVLLC